MADEEQLSVAVRGGMGDADRVRRRAPRQQLRSRRVALLDRQFDDRIDGNRGDAVERRDRLSHPPAEPRARHCDPPGSRRARARSEEHTSELQSLMRISYAVFCLKKTTKPTTSTTHE